MKKGLLLFFLSLLFVITKAQLSGTYTIDPRGDYTDITSACRDLMRQGVSGPTTFEISSGTYNEEISLTGPIRGAGARNPITFISRTNQAGDVIIYERGTTVTLSDVEYVNFHYLTLGDARVSERTVLFTRDNSNINFYGCVINTYNGDRDLYCGVYANSTSLSSIVFKKNTFNGGYSNLYFYDACGGKGNMSSRTTIVIDSNVLNGAYHSGIYASFFTYMPSISYNEVTTRVSSGQQYALYLTEYSTFDEIIGNKIFLMGTSDTYGMYLSMENNELVNTDEIKIYNNVIVKTTDGNAYGIFHEACKVKFYNNTIFFNNGRSDSYGIEIAKVSERHMFRASNNIIVCMNSGRFSYPISSTTATGVTAASGCYLDYNNYYSSVGSIASIGGVTITDMGDLRTATGQDRHSLSTFPYFYDFPNSLKVYGFDFTAPMFSDLTTDIDGLRRQNPTTWGAYQFVPFSSVDMHVDALVSPFETVYKGVKELTSVRVLNAGTSPITSATLYWSFNGVVQPSINWTGNLTTGNSTVINLDSITPISGVNSIKIYTALPGDTIHINDTIETYLFGCDSMLSGTYTVGRGKDFESLTDLYLQLHYCGIEGPVTLLLDPGRYGSVEITETFPGSSRQNTITLTSATGDSTDVIFSSTTNAIVLKNVANLILHKVTIDATNGEVGVLFAGHGENIEISNCLIRAKTTSTSTYRGVSKSSGTIPLANVKFLNNNIQGGYYGIYLSGNNSTDRNTDIIIDGNIINSMNYGIYGYQTVFNYVNNNVITQDLSSTAAYYGMSFSNGYAKQIVGNKIRADKKMQYGIHFTGAFAGTSTNRLLVANNELILTGSNAAAHGIYIGSTNTAEYTDIYHNSILMKGSIGTGTTIRSSCLYLVKKGDNLNIKNNNFVNILTSYNQNANTFALWISNATYLAATTILDYNNYYTSGNNLMRVGSNVHHQTLNAWIQATSKDSNSMNILPDFTDSTYGDLHTDGSSIVCPILTEVSHDIENKIRADSLTNMGCYHDLSLLSSDITIQAFISPINGAEKCLNDNMTVEITLANVGKDIDMGVTPLSIHLRVNGVITHQQDTIITSGAFNNLQTLNVKFSTIIPLLDTGMCDVSVYISKIDDNSTNDTLRSSIRIISIEDTYDTICLCNNELPFTYGDSVFIAAGDYDVYFTSISGCDSLVKLSLFVNPTYLHRDRITICDSELPLTYGDSVFVAAGDYDVYFTTINGCDSLIKLFLFVNPTYLHRDRITICDSELPFTYGDSVFAVAGDYDVYFTTVNGCDSLVKLSLFVNPTYLHRDRITICDSELPFTYGDSVFVVAGDYDVYFTTINACDSVVKLSLYVNPTYEYYDTLTVCDSELPFTYGDSVFAVAGNYDVHFTTINACDSVVKLSLYVNPTYEYYDTLTICDSELPFTYGDSIFVTAGGYDVYFTAISGCDSLVKLSLYVNPTYEYYDTLTICDSELPLNYGDSVLTEAGDYTIVYISEFGCDSTVFLSLSTIEIPTSPVGIYGETTILTVGTYMYYVDPVEGATSYAWTVSNLNWTGSSTTDTLMVYIPDAGTATISVKAVNDCGESDVVNLNIASSVSIIDNNNTTWTLGQNIPNPALQSTAIPYTLPQAGKVNFKVINVSGQVLYQENVNAKAGANYLHLTTESLANGIYYYSMEYKGQRIVKKMTIQK